MIRQFLRPISWVAQRMRRLSTAKRQLKDDVRYDPTLLLPKIDGYTQVNVAYRCPPRKEPVLEALHDISATLIWFWIFYQLYHNHAMLHEYHAPPDPEKWTDEELGIPPE